MNEGERRSVAISGYEDAYVSCKIIVKSEVQA